MRAARSIAVDWGTSRLRAYLLDGTGHVLERAVADEGMAKVAAGAFAATLLKHIGAWPALPVFMAGMVGSRNGWAEVPYAACPAPLAAIAAGAMRVEIAPGRSGLILPGLACRNEGVPDVMRGEETLILGCGLEDGTVILPGTHSKWAVLHDGAITGFRTFMTGEVFALLAKQSILRLLATEPADQAGFPRGLAAVARPGGLTHQAFAARSAVLQGSMTGAEVEPYLSGLLIGHEIAAAEKPAGGCVLVADGQIAINYAAGLAARGIAARVITPEAAFIAGIAAVAAAGDPA